MWRIKTRFGKYNINHIQTQVMHCIKKCKIHPKINYNPKTLKKI